MTNTPSPDALRLLRTLYKDDRNEGDLMAFSTETVAECLQSGYMKITACTRPGKNCRLTVRGVTALNTNAVSK